jgi:hypothetical protein
MAAYRFGDILLLSFPFTGGIGSKRGPALVLLDTGDADVLVARITSQSARTPAASNLSRRDEHSRHLLSTHYPFARRQPQI